jgi:hypothetical protein
LNRYAYARNNPVIYTDPTGNFFWFIAIAIAAIVQAAAAAAAAAVAAYSAAVAFVAGGLGAIGIHGTISTILTNAIVGAATGATLATADAAINGQSVGKSAAFGAIGGAVSAGIVGPGGGAISNIADKMGLGIVAGIARVGLGSYQTFTTIHNKSYFSGAFSAINTLATATIVADQIYSTLTDATSPEKVIANKTVQKEFEQAWKDSNPSDNNDPKTHEQGGWIKKKLFGKLNLERWPGGDQAQMIPPAKPRNAIMTFHTHPNYGPEWVQGPSDADKRFAGYVGVGGFVINKENYVYYDKNEEKNVWHRN